MSLGSAQLTKLGAAQTGASAFAPQVERSVADLRFVAVLSKSVATPPGSPGEGDAYIPGTSGTGDWVGLSATHMVLYLDGAWWARKLARGTPVIVLDEGETYTSNGVVLTSNNRTVGTAFPTTNLYDGRPFTRTDLTKPNRFYYDTTRSKWLGVDLIWFEATSGLMANDYLDLYPGVVKMGSGIGWQVPWDFTVVGVHAYKADTGATLIARLRRNTSNVAQVAFATVTDHHIQDFTLNVDGTATTAITDAITMFATISSGAMNAPGLYVRYYLRRKP